jgi:hypothetical protein
MTHDLGDPERILPAAQRIGGKAVAVSMGIKSVPKMGK